jgi:phosphoribosylamine--glycine ligase/phosphoribosylformylglycinamidine cyclo-ligase
LADLAFASGVLFFHAGTAQKDGQLVTAGGRVLGVTATGKTLREAVDLAYKGVQCVSWEGMTYRKDIAHRCVLHALSNMKC